MKKTVIFTMMALGSLIANAQASDKLAGNEILAVQKAAYQTRFSRRINRI
jgi:hypothetical protein